MKYFGFLIMLGFLSLQGFANDPILFIGDETQTEWESRLRSVRPGSRIQVIGKDYRVDEIIDDGTKNLILKVKGPGNEPRAVKLGKRLSEKTYFSVENELEGLRRVSSLDLPVVEVYEKWRFGYEMDFVDGETWWDRMDRTPRLDQRIAEIEHVRRGVVDKIGSERIYLDLNGSNIIRMRASDQYVIIDPQLYPVDQSTDSFISEHFKFEHQLERMKAQGASLVFDDGGQLTAQTVETYLRTYPDDVQPEFWSSFDKSNSRAVRAVGESIASNLKHDYEVEKFIASDFKWFATVSVDHPDAMIRFLASKGSDVRKGLPSAVLVEELERVGLLRNPRIRRAVFTNVRLAEESLQRVAPLINESEALALVRDVHAGRSSQDPALIHRFLKDRSTNSAYQKLVEGLLTPSVCISSFVRETL